MANKKTPKVSIIIPVFNGADFLCEAIDSALAQTYPNIEILVVNDGSTDSGDTERVILSYGNKIRYFSKPNGGVASALNLGIRNMTGEYFSWLSHDDLYYPNKISSQIEFLLAYPGADKIVFSNYEAFSKKNKKPIKKLTNLDTNNFRFYITIRNDLHGCTLLIPRIAFDKAGLFDEDLLTTQDFDMWFRLASYFNFVHQDQVLVKARQHINQGSKVNRALAQLEADNLLLNFVKNLTVTEVSSNAKHSPSLGYAFIALSMIFRGYENTANFSINMAKECLYNDSVMGLIKTGSLILSVKLFGKLKRLFN